MLELVCNPPIPSVIPMTVCRASCWEEEDGVVGELQMQKGGGQRTRDTDHRPGQLAEEKGEQWSGWPRSAECAGDATLGVHGPALECFSKHGTGEAGQVGCVLGAQPCPILPCRAAAIPVVTAVCLSGRSLAVVHAAYGLA